MVHQLEVLNTDNEGLQERDLHIRTITGNSKEYAHFKVKTGTFCILLIGKDGTQKLRSPEPVSLKTLFGLIDAMPMRRDEIKNRK